MLDELYTFSGSSDFFIEDDLGRKSGFLNGSIIEEIPGANVIIPDNYSFDSNNSENTFKQIYLPNKINNLKVNILGKKSEKYTLMLLGGNYYTKIDDISTNKGELDKFEISKDNINFKFDNKKTGRFNLKVDNFEKKLKGNVYIDSLPMKNNLQKINIDWKGLSENKIDAIKYGTDINNNGKFEKSSKLKNLKKVKNDNIFSGKDL